MNPKVEAMQNPDGKHDGPSQQETPKRLSKAGKDMREPRKETNRNNRKTYC